MKFERLETGSFGEERTGAGRPGIGRMWPSPLGSVGRDRPTFSPSEALCDWSQSAAHVHTVSDRLVWAGGLHLGTGGVLMPDRGHQ